MKARLPQGMGGGGARKFAAACTPGTEDAGADGADYHGARGEGIHRGRRAAEPFPQP